MMISLTNQNYFYQWDINQKITSDSFAVDDEIHFYNRKQTMAFVTKAYEFEGKVVANVPNILLTSSYPIVVYRYIYEADTGHTIEQQTFDVKQRAKPDPYLYVEDELYTITLALEKATEAVVKDITERINKSEQNVKESEINVKAAEENVLQVEQETLDAKDTAVNSAQNAKLSEANAKNSATVAENAKNSAEILKDEVLDLKGDVQQIKMEVSEFIDDANDAANTAKTYRDSASSYCDSALENANEAQKWANTAKQNVDVALAQAKESGEFDGQDGTSTTHEWDGTVLTVTSASGTSSADLKGEKGDKGDPGKDAPSESILYLEQTLTDVQQAQARENIGAIKTWDELVGKPLTTEELLAIQQDLADLKYVPIAISSVTNTVGTVEIGRTITEVTVKWTLNKNPESQTVNGEKVAVTDRSKAYNKLAITHNSSTDDKKFIVTATDERGKTVSKDTSIAFCNGVYYGVLEDGATINDASILTLNKKLQTTRGLTFTANAGATQRIIYALPMNGYGTPAFKDKDTGFQMGFYLATPDGIDFTNGSGYMEKYNVWLSTNPGLGNRTVEVS